MTWLPSKLFFFLREKMKSYALSVGSELTDFFFLDTQYILNVYCSSNTITIYLFSIQRKCCYRRWSLYVAKLTQHPVKLAIIFSSYYTSCFLPRRKTFTLSHSFYLSYDMGIPESRQYGWKDNFSTTCTAFWSMSLWEQECTFLEITYQILWRKIKNLSNNWKSLKMEIPLVCNIFWSYEVEIESWDLTDLMRYQWWHICVKDNLSVYFHLWIEEECMGKVAI